LAACDGGDFLCLCGGSREKRFAAKDLRLIILQVSIRMTKASVKLLYSVKLLCVI